MLEEDKPFDFTKDITKSTTLVAAWINADSKNYEVIFKYDNNMKDVVIKVEENKKILSPANPTKNGYEFVDWYIGENVYDFDLLVTDNLTLVARWKELEIPKNYKEEKTATASCNDGYKLSGDKCIKSETIVAIKGCPSGYTLKNNACIKTEEKNTTIGCSNNKIFVNGYCWNLGAQGVTVNNAKKCNDGFTYNTDGGGSGWCEANSLTKIESVLCLSGEFVIDTTSCHSVLGRVSPSTGKCSSGKVFNRMNNDKCYSIEPISDGYCAAKSGFVHRFRYGEDTKSCAYYEKQEVNRICTDGVSTFINGKCYKDKTVTENVCEADYTKNGTKCQKTLTENIQFSCNVGYSLKDNNCVKDISVSPNLNCPSGFKLSGTKCYK